FNSESKLHHGRETRRTENLQQRDTDRGVSHTSRSCANTVFPTGDTQDHEEMSSDGQYISVMKGKSQAFWIVLAGVFLAARVCDAECIKLNFKAHIMDHLLIDHWFQMKNFTPTGEEVKEQHELLSVVNTICSSLLANEMFYHPNPINKTIQTKVVWTYLQMVKALGKCFELE
ncbi:hypothetical protein PGIGA_G00041540, partial [Pangasianodon gigas]|nr:hypothetical protein [Pangasianodon gigas]